MYGSFGSYSSLSSASAPMDITSSNLRSHEATCMFPSWPRRSSLSDDDQDQRPTSYISDEDLLFLPDPFEDDVRSISSTSTSTSSASSPALELSPSQLQQRQLHEFQEQQRKLLAEAEVLEMERERIARQRHYVNQIIGEKQRRRHQTAKPRRSGSPTKKSSPKSKLSAMTPIAE